MINKDTKICFCNDKSAGEIVEFVRANNIKSVEALVEQDDFEVGNKCGSCVHDGYEEDEHTLTNLFKMIETNKI